MLQMRGVDQAMFALMPMAFSAYVFAVKHSLYLLRTATNLGLSVMGTETVGKLPYIFSGRACASVQNCFNDLLMTGSPTRWI